MLRTDYHGVTVDIRFALIEPRSSYPKRLLRDLTDCFVDNTDMLKIIQRCYDSPESVEYIERYELFRAVFGLILAAHLHNDSKAAAKLSSLYDQLYELITKTAGEPSLSTIIG